MVRFIAIFIAALAFISCLTFGIAKTTADLMRYENIRVCEEPSSPDHA